jgi:predicted RNA binding protein YcfA (HicA-like mRNA interferase family)
LKLPRSLSGADLAKALRRLGYQEVRQSGSHLRLSAPTPHGNHSLTIPLHESLRVGTLAAILGEVERAQDMSRDELLERLFT